MVARPEDRGKPYGVLTNNDACIASASKELKALGVKVGTPVFEFRNLIKKFGIILKSSQFETFHYLSSLMFMAVRNRVPDVCVYSLDEGFFLVDNRLVNELIKFGLLLKAHVFKHSRIPVCVGFGPNKLLAKQANKYAKKNPECKGVFEITEYNVDWILSNTAIEDLWGIGEQSANKLRALGIKNALQFRDFPHVDIVKKLLTITGRKLQLELQGYNCHELHEQPKKKNSISHTRTFGSRIHTKDTLREAIASFATKAADELRKQGSVCRKIKIFIVTDRYRLDLPQYGAEKNLKLHGFTLDTTKIISEVWNMLDEIFKPGFEYRKAGVILSDFQDFSEHRLSLIGTEDSTTRIELMKTIDLANKIFGEDIIQSAACGVRSKEEWKMNRKTLEPPQYTRWESVEKIMKVLT